MTISTRSPSLSPTPLPLPSALRLSSAPSSPLDALKSNASPSLPPPLTLGSGPYKPTLKERRATPPPLPLASPDLKSPDTRPAPLSSLNLKPTSPSKPPPLPPISKAHPPPPSIPSPTLPPHSPSLSPSLAPSPSSIPPPPTSLPPPLPRSTSSTPSPPKTPQRPSSPPARPPVPLLGPRTRRWTPHPQTFSIPEEPPLPPQDEDAHWAALCRLHPPHSLHRYFPSSIAPPPPPPPPSLLSLLPAPFIAACTAGLPCRVQRSPPRLLSPPAPATLRIHWADGGYLSFGPRRLPLSALYSATSPSPSHLLLRLPTHTLRLKAVSPAVLALYLHGFRALVHHHHSDPQPVVYEPTAFLKDVQAGIPVKRWGKGGQEGRQGKLVVSIREARLQWMEDAVPAPTPWWRRRAATGAELDLATPGLAVLSGHCTKGWGVSEAARATPPGQCFSIVCGGDVWDVEMDGGQARDVFVRGLKDLVEVLQEAGVKPRGKSSSTSAREVKARVLETPPPLPSLPLRKSVIQPGRVEGGSKEGSVSSHRGSFVEKRREMEARRALKSGGSRGGGEAVSRSSSVSVPGVVGSRGGSARSSVSLSSLSLSEGGDEWEEWDMECVTRPRSTGAPPVLPFAYRDNSQV